jgi:hypothetical protein
MEIFSRKEASGRLLSTKKKNLSYAEMDSISALLPPVCSSIYPPSPASLEARGGRKIKSLQGTLELQWAFSQV